MTVVETTVSGMLVELMKKHGVRTVFGLPAAPLILVMDGVSKDPFFTHITTRHEEAAGHMAHAAYLATGEMAVCYGTNGPGATNLVPGVAAAWADNIPMLVLTGAHNSDRIDPSEDILQALDQVALYRPITKWNAQIRSAARAPQLIERALTIAVTGKPGPVHLDIPADVATWPCRYDLDSVAVRPRPRPVPSPGELVEVVGMLEGAERPLLLAGGGVARSVGAAAFRKLVAVTGFPAATTPKGFGVADIDGPTHVGSAGWLGGPGLVDAAAQADVILAIGCKFTNWTPIGKPPYFSASGDQAIVQIDIDSEMLGKNVAIRRGVVGDARETLNALAAAIDAARLSVDRDWVAGLVAKRQAFVQEIDELADAETTDDTTLLNGAAVAREIVRAAPTDAVFCVDGGQTTSWAATLFRPVDHAHVTWNPGMGHMGVGLPQAIGVKASRPEATVVLLTGDGSAGLTVQELETSVRYGLKIVMVVFNDSHWGIYKPFTQLLGNTQLGTDLTDVDFASVARSFGCRGEHVEKLADLGPALSRALAAEETTVIDVVGDMTPHPMDHHWAYISAGVNLPAAEPRLA
jgi:acetolactate synthase-1/2/3 large subunit